MGYAVILTFDCDLNMTGKIIQLGVENLEGRTEYNLELPEEDPGATIDKKVKKSGAAPIFIGIIIGIGISFLLQILIAVCWRWHLQRNKDQIFYFGFKPKPISKRSSCHLPYDNEGYQETLDELISERGKREEAEISAKLFKRELEQEKSNHLSVFIKYKDIQKELAKLKNEREQAIKQERNDYWRNRLDSMLQYLQKPIFQFSINKLQFNNTLQRKTDEHLCDTQEMEPILPERDTDVKIGDMVILSDNELHVKSEFDLSNFIWDDQMRLMLGEKFHILEIFDHKTVALPSPDGSRDGKCYFPKSLITKASGEATTIQMGPGMNTQPITKVRKSVLPHQELNPVSC